MVIGGFWRNKWKTTWKPEPYRDWGFQGLSEHDTQHYCGWRKSYDKLFAKRPWKVFLAVPRDNSCSPRGQGQRQHSNTKSKIC